MATGSFETAVMRFREKAMQRVEQVERKVVLDLGTSVVLKTPVDTGRLRGNWQHGVMEIPAGTLEITDMSGGATIGRIAASLGTISGLKVHYLANNLPYAVPIEYGRSKQAPAGMVGVSIAEFGSLVVRAAREANP